MLLAIFLALVTNQGSDTTVVRELEAMEQRLAATWQRSGASAVAVIPLR
jgi:hypothetical protein